MATSESYYPSKHGVEGTWNPPNIVFIIADDIGYGDLGPYGQAHIETPNLDRMAAEGQRHTNCYTGSPVCAPSRSVLMTGQHAGHTRVRDNFGMVGGARVVDNGPVQHRIPLGPDDPCIPEILTDAGYATGAFGKWGLGEAHTSGAPTRKGFDEWFGYLNQRRAHTYYPPYLWDGETKVPIDGNEDEGRAQHAQDLVMDRAADFIHDHADERFFCFLPTTLPHTPHEAPDEESAAQYADRTDWTERERDYAAMVSRLDRDVGTILDLLADLDIDEDTIVFFCSDHGPVGSLADTRFDCAGGHRGFKYDLYDGGIRTPMLVRWPGHIEAGSVDDTPWYYADVLPTLAEIAGVWPDPGHQWVSDADGVSVLPTVLGDDQPLHQRIMYWEFLDAESFDGSYGQAARRGEWKALRPAVDEPVELYNVVEDPAETIDRATEHPDLVARFTWYLDQSHVPVPQYPEW